MIDEIILCFALVITLLLGRISNGRKSLRHPLSFRERITTGPSYKASRGAENSEY